MGHLAHAEQRQLASRRVIRRHSLGESHSSRSTAPCGCTAPQRLRGGGLGGADRSRVASLLHAARDHPPSPRLQLCHFERSRRRAARRGESVYDRRAHICGLTTWCSRATAPTPPMLVVISSGDRSDSRRRLLPHWPRCRLVLSACAHTGAGAGAATRMRAGRVGARVWREGGQVGRRVRSSSVERFVTCASARSATDDQHGRVLGFLVGRELCTPSQCEGVEHRFCGTVYTCRPLPDDLCMQPRVIALTTRIATSILYIT